MTRDEAVEFTLAALADMPSGPPAEEILAVIQAGAWDEGKNVRRCDGVPPNPYRHDDTQGEK